MINQGTSKYNENEPYSFGGKFRLVEYVGKKKADDIVSRSDINTRFKQHRKTKKFSPIYVYNRRDLFQSDVVFFTNRDVVEANNITGIFLQPFMYLQRWHGFAHFKPIHVRILLRI